MPDRIEPFVIGVDGAALDDLRDRLRRARWPEREPVGDWSQACPPAWRCSTPAAGISGWATAVAVFLLVTLALSLLAALIGLLGKSVEVAQQFGAIVIIPVFFSSALVPVGTMPSWLRVVSANQPITQAVGTLRALLLNQPPGSHLWLTLTEFSGIIVAAFTLAAILFKRTANA